MNNTKNNERGNMTQLLLSVLLKYETKTFYASTQLSRYLLTISNIFISTQQDYIQTQLVHFASTKKMQ